MPSALRNWRVRTGAVGFIHKGGVLKLLWGRVGRQNAAFLTLDSVDVGAAECKARKRRFRISAVPSKRRPKANGRRSGALLTFAGLASQ